MTRGADDNAKTRTRDDVLGGDGSGGVVERDDRMSDRKNRGV